MGLWFSLVGLCPVKGQLSALRLVSDTTCNGRVQLHLMAQQMPAINALTLAIPYDTLVLTFDTLIRRHPRLNNGSFNPRNPLRGMVFSWFINDSVIFGADTLLTMRLRSAPDRGGTFNIDPVYFFCGLNNVPVPLNRFGCTWRSQGPEPPLTTGPPQAQGVGSTTFLFSYLPGYCTDTILFQWSRNNSFPQPLTTTAYVGRSQRIPSSWSQAFAGFNIPGGDSVLYWRWAAILQGDTVAGTISRLVLPPCNAQGVPAFLQATICQGNYYLFGGDTLRNPGLYNDTLVALNGCDSVVILQLRVNAAPQANLIAFGNTVLCQGDSVTLSAGSGLNLIYAWRRNGVIITAASSSTYQATLAGSYQVLITDTNGCSSWSNTLNVQVNPRPQPVASLSGRLLSLSGGPFASYQWYRNSLVIVGATMSTYTADSGGVYACLVSQGGCSALSNLVTVVGVGFESLEQTRWWLYPNPSRGMLMLRGAAATSAYLIDLGGRRVFLNVQNSSFVGEALGMGDQSLDLGDVPSGVYWLELYGERNRFLGRRKLIHMKD